MFDGFSPETVEAPWFVPAGEGCYRMWPHKLLGEGHFAAVLKKTSGEETEIPAAPGGTLPKEWSDFAKALDIRLPAGKEAGDYVFRVDGELQTPEGEALASGGREVALMVSNIAPNQLNTAHTFSISDGRETFTVTSSVLGYAKNKAHNGSANMKILAKALCNYYTEALEYIGE